MWSLFLFYEANNIMQALIGLKKEQSQRFLENGNRVPVTIIDVKGNTIVALKTQEKDKYQAVQLGFSMKRHASKAELGHAKGAKLEKAPKFLKEVKIKEDDVELPAIGTVLNPQEVFEPGDMVDVSGFSKGKGFQGGVKRWGFHGGPKTHGQSDRHRAPGSIGQGTTPGRVYKGKKMAGNMGNENVTIKNLEVLDVTSDGTITIKGLVPGILNGPLMIFKTGKDKNFVPFYESPESPSASAENKDTEKQVENAVDSAKQAVDKLEVENEEKPIESMDTNIKVEKSDEKKEAEGDVNDDNSKESEINDDQNVAGDVKVEEEKSEQKVEKGDTTDAK